MSVGTPGDKAHAFKKLVVDAAREVCMPLAEPDHPLLVRFGRPSKQQLANYDDIVGATRVTATFEQGPMGGQRSRDMTITVTVVVSVWRAGYDGDLDDVDLEEQCGDRAYTLLSALEEHIRVADPPQLDGQPVHWAFASGHESDGMTDPALLARGRCIEIDAQIQTKVRIAGR